MSGIITALWQKLLEDLQVPFVTYEDDPLLEGGVATYCDGCKRFSLGPVCPHCKDEPPRPEMER